jgi:DNA-binding transcriptional ArsR family regulator
MSPSRSIFNHMVEELEGLDGVFHALAHAARRDMLGRLADRDLTVGELAAPFSMSLAAASKHVQVLERAQMVQRTIDGRRHVCRLRPAPLASAAGWLEHIERFWSESLDGLQALVEDDTTDERNTDDS